MSFVCRGVIDAEGSLLRLEVEVPPRLRRSFFEFLAEGWPAAGGEFEWSGFDHRGRGFYPLGHESVNLYNVPVKVEMNWPAEWRDAVEMANEELVDIDRRWKEALKPLGGIEAAEEDAQATQIDEEFSKQQKEAADRFLKRLDEAGFRV